MPYKDLALEMVIDQDRANITLVLIPPGQFFMGSPNHELGRNDDETQHCVVIPKPYYMGKTTITQAQWEAVVSVVPQEEWRGIFGKNQWPDSTMDPKPSHFKNAGPFAPVERINWYQCAAFCEKLGGTLPTEAQWEFACRSGVTAMTYTGDFEIKGCRNAPGLDSIAWYSGNSGVNYEGWDSSNWPEKQYAHTKAGTHPVREKQPNHYDLYDTLGNIWEWCQDEYKAYPTSQLIDNQSSASKKWVFRGGSWLDYAWYCRAAHRNRGGIRGSFLGFRFSKSIGTSIFSI